jgi:hypothetical protein
MPGWPDWQKTTAWTFPPTLADANIVTNFANFTADTTVTINAYTDGLIHVLYVVTVLGSVFNVSTVTDSHCLLRVRFSRGFDNGGTPGAILTANYYTPVGFAGASAPGTAISMILTQPILFQAGSAGTPNNLDFLSSSGSTTYKASVGWNVIDWAVT